MKTNKKPVNNKAPQTEQPKGKKLLLFKTLSVLSPFIIWFVLEVFLRIINYGDNTDLFIKYPPDPRYMVMNYYASEKFFPDTVNSTIGNQEIFAIDKAPNTIRIFVLGESTTIGFPYNPNGSFHRWLQYRLMHMYPDKNFEIINLSLTAVNSYTVLDFGKQLAQYKPDAVLIYTGHNEYYGALGIGSTTYVGSNRFLIQLLIRLRELRSVQLFKNAIDKVAGLFAHKLTGDPASLMKVLAKKQHIIYGSKEYKAGIDQFDKNMTELCSTLNEAQIPTFLSTVVSNEKDLPPFISDGSGKGSANWYYSQGQQAYKNGNYDTAKADFDKASEMDELRFRAPQAINIDIKKLAGEFPYVHLVDSKKLFEQYSPHGIVGSETILEHVHPNLYGYAILSEAFYRAIEKLQIVKAQQARDITFDELRKEMPITHMDSLKGTYQMMMLKTGWPFNQPIPKGFKVENSINGELATKVALGHMAWEIAMGKLYRYDQKNGNNADALQVVEGMVLQLPQTPDFYSYSGNLNYQLKNYAEAAFYYHKLFMLNHDTQTAQSVFKLYLKAGDPVSALAFAQYMPNQQPAAAIVNQLIEDDNRLKTKPGDTKIQQQISAGYKQLGIDTLK
jgi:tetratricopeptide (TPR) repeat protein